MMCEFAQNRTGGNLDSISIGYECPGNKVANGKALYSQSFSRGVKRSWLPGRKKLQRHEDDRRRLIASSCLCCQVRSLVPQGI